MSNETPTIEMIVILNDGLPALSVKADHLKTPQDFELLLAAAFNGMNLNIEHYAAQRGDHPEAVKLRIQRMIQELAKGNDTSPMQFQAYTNASTSDTTRDEEEEGREAGEGPTGGNRW